jgi:hypothetical protein
MPLPSLEKDEDDYYWTGRVEIPWYRTEEPPHFTLMHPDDEDWNEPRPREAQRAAFEQFITNGHTLRPILLERFHHYVPQLKNEDWSALEAFFQLTEVRLYPIDQEGLAYIGLGFCCLQWDYGYEHGVGIILHGQRIVHFGMAEEANTGEKAYIDAGLLEPDEEDEELLEE